MNYEEYESARAEHANTQEDPRLTTYVLGELSEEEREQVEALLEEKPELAAFVQELREASELLAGELVDEGTGGLTEGQREKIGEAARETEQQKSEESSAMDKPQQGPFFTRREWIAVACAAGLLLVAGTYAFSTGWFEGADDRLAVGTSNPPRGTPQDSEFQQALNGLDYSVFPGADRTVIGASQPSRSVQDSLAASGYGLGYSGGPGSPAEALRGLGYTGRSSPNETSSARTRSFPVEIIESSGEEYAHQPENDFVSAKDEPLSTFAIDVDTASYTNVRRLLSQGQTPPVGAIRIEEMLNYFPYQDEPPLADTGVPFRVHTELFTAPWKREHQLLRIALATKAVEMDARKPSNLVFLLDVSGSMSGADKLPLLKRALRMMVRELDERDRIAIVVYAGAAGLVLDSTRCDSPHVILDAIESLDAGGSTNGGAGIRLAYEVARRNFIQGGTNRVLLATDGDFNVGTSDTSSLVGLAKQQAKSGVFLTVLGFGSGNLQDSKMESIANKGNGHYAYIDSVLEARKVLVEELGSTLEVIAKDVKMQVEFNPAEVASYRLIGYENRLLAARDFADDSKDAGEMGAGHHVTALYELVLTSGGGSEGETPLRYQQDRQPTGNAFGGEVALVKLRWKAPAGAKSSLIDQVVPRAHASFDEASTDARFSAAVAAFGMQLRHSAHLAQADLPMIRSWAMEALGDDPGGYRAQFLLMVQRAIELGGVGTLKSLGYRR